MFPVLNQTFWDSVWASLLASCLMTFVISSIVIWCLRTYHKPKIEVFLDIGHRVNSDKVLHLKFVNYGRSEFKQNGLQWFIYMDFKLEPQGTPKTALLLDNEYAYEVSGTNGEAIHPDSVSSIADLVVKNNFEADTENVEFYIAISTAHGQWKPQKATKLVQLKTYGITRNIYRIENVST